MIRRLEVRDLVVIERAELAPPGGLTAITGETGAGKTVLAQALGLLTGAPADSGVGAARREAGAGAGRAVAAPGFWERLEDDDPALALRELAEDEDEVVLARRVPAEGRARAMIDGQAAPRDAVAALARSLVRFSAQHEHRRLGEPVQPARRPRRVRAGRTWWRWRSGCGCCGGGSPGSTAGWRRRAPGARRPSGSGPTWRSWCAAADAAALDLAEEAALRAERERLRHAEGLAAAASGAAEALAPQEGEGGALDLVGSAAAAVAPMIDVDEGLRGPHGDLLGAQASLQEVVIALRAYLEDLDAEPGRLAAVEERLEAYARMSRRYGPGTEAVLARADEAREALRGLDEGSADVLALAEEHQALMDEAVELAAALREARAAAAPRLAEAVQDELADLAMPRAELRVELVEDPGDPPHDSCVIWLRANPGLPEAPLAAAASGGELSRVLLALHGVAAAADDATWVLDEVDAGIGGITATAVGARLRGLADGRQVIVITHLPQVAAMADAHYRMVKGIDDAGRATTRIEPVSDGALVEELVRMLGAGAGDAGARRHAEELLARRV